MKKKLTAAGVERMKAPSSGRLEVFDTLLPGFGLRVSESGRKSWFVMYRLHGKLIRQTIDTYPKLDLEEARNRARAALEMVDGGNDPRKPERVRKNRTYGWVREQFIEKYAKRKNRDWKKTESQLKSFKAWDDRPISEITREDVIDELDEYIDKGQPYAANRRLAAVRRMFNWSIQRGYLTASVVAGIEPPGNEAPRQRAFSADEIKTLWKAAESLGHPVGPWLQLLLATGQRPGEVARIQKQDIQGDVWLQPENKSGRQHSVPLSDLALEIIEALPEFDESYLFTTTGGKRPISGFSKIKAKIEQAMGAEHALGDWRFHDCRRTVYTEMSRLKIPPHIKERVFNHSYGGRVEKAYDVWEYVDEKRDALQQWADRLRALVSENVTVLEMRHAR